ncbi:unnamed protein product [Coregonus sp. 'balchen']|nr:unnamed protein product [Coregonus sp. 'balchen']
METEGKADEGSSSQRDPPQNTGSYDLSLTLQDFRPTEDSQPAEKSVLVEEPIVLLCSSPFLLTSQNQVILLDTLDQEVTKFRECNSLLDLNSMFTEAKLYHGKLVNIRKDMIMLHEKTTKLKKRALKLQQQREKEAMEKEQQREKELERERQLIAKPAKRT